MFDSLSERLGSIFEKLRGRGALEEKDVDAALREVRVALLEADVALEVAAVWGANRPVHSTALVDEQAEAVIERVQALLPPSPR